MVAFFTRITDAKFIVCVHLTAEYSLLISLKWDVVFIGSYIPLSAERRSIIMYYEITERICCRITKWILKNLLVGWTYPRPHYSSRSWERLNNKLANRIMHVGFVNMES